MYFSFKLFFNFTFFLDPGCSFCMSAMRIPLPRPLRCSCCKARSPSSDDGVSKRAALVPVHTHTHTYTHTMMSHPLTHGHTHTHRRQTKNEVAALKQAKDPEHLIRTPYQRQLLAIIDHKEKKGYNIMPFITRHPFFIVILGAIVYDLYWRGPWKTSTMTSLELKEVSTFFQAIDLSNCSLRTLQILKS